MQNHRITNNYSQAFATFLQHTDEKTVLNSALLQRIHLFGTTSLLDIGAGNGELSIPLAQKVENYLAVEQKEDFAARLRSAGLAVINSPFPCEIPSTFDAVLICHALPPHELGRAAWDPFISAAWQQVNGSGHLFIVTFENEESEWRDLIHSSGLAPTLKPQVPHLQPMRGYLDTLGNVREEMIVSRVRTSTIQEMLWALSFVWSDGKEEYQKVFVQNTEVARQIEERYREKDGYAFPFRHYLLDTSRQPL